MEAATGREALWVTTQFVATTEIGSVIDVSTDVLASGRAISQVQVTARHDGRTLFVALGSTATPRPGGLDGQYETMPAVSAPEDSEPMQLGPTWMEDRGGLHDNIEYRPARVLEADGAGPAGGRPTMALWARLTGGRRCTRAGIAFLADMVPPAIARAAGKLGGGPSLDNSLRFGRLDSAPEWILLDLRGHMAYGAHGHGSVWVWSPDGNLLAIGDQSANMVHTVDAG
jgi:acyl-CoA thioesterase